MPRKYADHEIVGKTFGYWRAVAAAPKTGRDRLFVCECRCGARRSVRLDYLVRGASTSCGCKRAESLRRDGKGKHPLYPTWRGMIERCENPNHNRYRNYGGRGIRVCARWRKDFWAFAADVGTRPAGTSLDRIDVNGDYAPGNVRWATGPEQQRNKQPRYRLDELLPGATGILMPGFF